MVRWSITLALLLGAAPALACGSLEKAEPRVGSTVSMPDYVTLRFTEAVDPAQSSIGVTDAAGRPLKLDEAKGSTDDTALSVRLPALSPGRYAVRWQAYWADCDSTSHGDFGFTVK